VNESVAINERPGRLLSIDALRGFDMIWIAGAAQIVEGFHELFDNRFTAALCEQLHHAKWVGFTFEDIIMPLFMFLAGVSLVLSFQRRSESQSRGGMYGHVFRRVAILWFFGMIYQGNLLDLKWEKLEFFSNTLQAIAVGYLGSSLILLLKNVKLQVAVTAALLLGYWAILHLVPVPEYGVGNLTVEGNMAAHVDSITMGIHDDFNSKGVSEYTWVLSSMNFIVTVMFGCFAGQILLRKDWTPPKIAKQLCLFGVASLAIGCLWTVQDPCIKKIWTSSFTLISGGICVLMLAAFYFYVEVLNRRWLAQFFTVIGSNAIFVYMIFAYKKFIDMDYPAEKLVYGLEQYVGQAYPLVLSTVSFLLMWCVLWGMYRKKVFFKV